MGLIARGHMVLVQAIKLERTVIIFTKQVFVLFIYFMNHWLKKPLIKRGNGPHLEVLQYQGNPWNGGSKLHTPLLLTKIGLIARGPWSSFELLNSKEQLKIFFSNRKDRVIQQSCGCRQPKIPLGKKPDGKKRKVCTVT